MKKEIENKLRRFFKIDNDYENYRGVHYYEDINVSDILLNEVTGEFTIHFDRVLKTVTEDEYGVDLGAWNDGITKTPMVAKLDKNLNILSTN